MSSNVGRPDRPRLCAAAFRYVNTSHCWCPVFVAGLRAVEEISEVILKILRVLRCPLSIDAYQPVEEVLRVDFERDEIQNGSPVGHEASWKLAQ